MGVINCSCISEKNVKSHSDEVRVEENIMCEPVVIKAVLRGYVSRKKVRSLREIKNSIISPNEKVRESESKIGEFLWDENDGFGSKMEPA